MRPPLPNRSAPRVRLAYPRAADRREFLSLARASRAFHRGRVSLPRDPATFARYLVRCSKPNFVGLHVRRRADDALLGAIEISQIVHGLLRSAYLGYWVGAPHAGQGYMTEALPLALGFAFRTLRLHRLEANVQPGNDASLALVRRLGFTREGYSRRYLKIAGRWRDHERWALLVEDWKPPRCRPLYS